MTEQPGPEQTERRWGRPARGADGITLANRAALDADDVPHAQIATSPIARRIFTVNMLAMGVLIIGILFVNQFERGLTEQRVAALSTEAEVAARAVAAFGVTDRGGAAELDPARVREVLRVVAQPEGSRVRVYDLDQVLVADSRAVLTRTRSLLEAARAAVPSGAVREEVPQPNLVDRILDSVARVLAPGDSNGADIHALSELDIALGGLAASVVTRDEGGNLILSIALPVWEAGSVRGAVVLSTLGGDIDAIVARERGQVLIVFGLALAISVALSMVLAAGIARPLRLLAAAAERGGASDPHQRLNPDRFRIPDLSERPDEIGSLSKALRGMTRALFDRIEANESFAADVAHEIKNPLTSLRSAVETMRYAKTEDQRSRLMDVIESDVQRLDRLVTDISNASRLDSELVREDMEAFDLHKLMENIVGFNQSVAEANGVQLALRHPDDPRMISGLEGRLAQVFVNLVTNAISFSPEGSTVTVTVHAPIGEGVRITVEDQGPGIPDDNLEDVFERFYSERPGQEFGNHSGLGLAISRQIVQAHGGRIWAENIRAGRTSVGPDAPRLGARFIVELPG